MSATTTTLRPGTTLWRIGHSGPLRCIVVRDRGVNVIVKASRFSRDDLAVIASDVFADRDECRAEIERRKQKERP